MFKVKKLTFLLTASFTLFCATNCGPKGQNYRINFSTNHVAFENKPTTINSSNDFVTPVHPTRSGYLLSESNFSIKVNDNNIQSGDATWHYSDNKLIIFKQTITGDIDVSTKLLFVNYSYDEKISPIGTLPTTINEKDFNVKFAVENGYGLKTDIDMNGKFDEYCVRKVSSTNNTNVYSIFIENKYIINDFEINLVAAEGELTLSRKKVELVNYDTINVYCYDPYGKEITASYSEIDKDKYKITKNAQDNNEFTIDSEGDDFVNNSIVTFKNNLNVTAELAVTIRHPNNVSEALNAVTLGFVRGNTNFDVTFGYDNNELSSDFINHLEIITNMQGSNGIHAYPYNRGRNQKNRFYLSNMPAHGLQYAYGTDQHQYYYRPVASANYLIRKSEMEKRIQGSPLPIDQLNKSIKVYTSEELYWAVEHGYIPLVNHLPASSSVVRVYESARSACLNEVNDKMSNFEKARQLFDYLENKITYDYDAANATDSYPTWLKYPAYFLEGVFLHDGLAVCDGFSKAYVLLGGIERVPIIRSSGFCNIKGETSGHAWNYVQIDDLWYLTCPTWAQIPIDKSVTNIYHRNFAIYNYGSFLTSCNYFSNYGMPFTDDNFPEIVRETTPYYSNLYEIDDFKYESKSYNFYIDSKDKMLAVFNKCHDCIAETQNFVVILKIKDMNSFYNSATKAGWFFDAYRESKMKKSGVILVSADVNMAYIAF